MADWLDLGQDCLCYPTRVHFMMFDRTIRHCRQCGAPVARRLPDDGDTKLRAICTACTTKTP